MIIAAFTAQDWSIIIGAFFTGLTGLVGAVIAAYVSINKKLKDAKTQREQSESKIFGKLDEAANKFIEAKSEPKPLLDVKTEEKLNDIHKATNGEMSRRFDRIDHDNAEIKMQVANLDARIGRIESATSVSTAPKL